MMGKSRPVRPRAFSLSWANRTSKPATSPARIECFDIFSPAPGDKDVISQVDRLSSKDAKIAGRSVWIAVDASVRSAATCMVVSTVGGLATSLCRARRSLSRRPWDLSPHTSCRSPGAPVHTITSTVFIAHTCLTVRLGFNKFNGLTSRQGAATEPLLAKCDNALRTPSTLCPVQTPLAVRGDAIPRKPLFRRRGGQRRLHRSGPVGGQCGEAAERPSHLFATGGAGDHHVDHRV